MIFDRHSRITHRKQAPAFSLGKKTQPRTPANSLLAPNSRQYLHYSVRPQRQETPPDGEESNSQYGGCPPAGFQDRPFNRSATPPGASDANAAGAPRVVPRHE